MNDHQFDEILGLLYVAEELCDSTEYEEAINACNVVVRDFANFDDPDIPEVIAAALLCKGRALAGLELFEDELQAYNEIVRRFKASDSGEVRSKVARALFNTAVATGQMGREEESLSQYASFVARYESDQDPDIQEQVARALLNTAITLRHSPRESEALAVFEAVIAGFGAINSPEISSTVVRALTSKAGLELCLEQPEAAIESASRALARCDAELRTERFHCHLALAVAHFITKDKASGENEIISALAVLPELAEPAHALHFSYTLRTVAEVLGRRHTLNLIQRSPSASILSSVANELEHELERETKSLRGLEDVARDLQQDFANSDRCES